MTLLLLLALALLLAALVWTRILLAVARRDVADLTRRVEEQGQVLFA